MSVTTRQRNWWLVSGWRLKSLKCYTVTKFFATFSNANGGVHSAPSRTPLGFVRTTSIILVLRQESSNHPPQPTRVCGMFHSLHLHTGWRKPTTMLILIARIRIFSVIYFLFWFLFLFCWCCFISPHSRWIASATTKWRLFGIKLICSFNSGDFNEFAGIFVSLKFPPGLSPPSFPYLWYTYTMEWACVARVFSVSMRRRRQGLLKQTVSWFHSDVRIGPKFIFHDGRVIMSPHSCECNGSPSEPPTNVGQCVLWPWAATTLESGSTQ